MHRRALKRLIDAEAVKRAIEQAERRTSGEIRVSVSTFFWGNVRRTAERSFARLGMDRTAQRNGVLFFVVPSRRTFVVLGDEGIHAKVGQDFWDSVAAAMSARFKDRDFTGGLVHASPRRAASSRIIFPARALVTRTSSLTTWILGTRDPGSAAAAETARYGRRSANCGGRQPPSSSPRMKSTERAISSDGSSNRSVCSEPSGPVVANS